MMQIKILGNLELVKRIEVLAAEERRITLALIECLEEISKRMIYAELGYPSLYAFCIQHLKLSGGSAHRRIEAMRLSRDVPAVKERLLSGELSLSNAAKIEVILKQTKNNLKPQVSKATIVDECLNLSQSECEIKLISLVPHAAHTKYITEKARAIDDQHSEIKLIISAELKSKIEELQELTSHCNPEKSLIKLLERLVSKELETEKRKRTPRARVPSDSEKRRFPSQTSKGLPTQIEYSLTHPAAGSDRIRPNKIKPHLKISRAHVPIITKREVWSRAQGQCQYKGCNSKFQLQIEHKKPVAKGGHNELSNLELLCRIHNVLRAKHEYGAHKMQKYVGSLANQTDLLNTNLNE